MTKSGFIFLLVLGLVATTHQATAFNIQSKNVKALHYEWEHSTKAYKAAWKAMSELYQNTRYNPANSYVEEPVIFYAQYDLNDDGVKEIIARPWEEMHEEGLFCKLSTTQCPHYIISIKEDEPVLLGIIFANAVDVDSKSSSTYKDLKVFTKEDDADINPKSFGFFETYKFNTDKKTYVDALVTPKAGKKEKGAK